MERDTDLAGADYEEPESKVEEKQEKRANVKQSLEGTSTAGKAG